MLFTFRRDDEGRETIEVNDLAIARITNSPEGFEWLNSMPGINFEHVREAMIKVDEAGFWPPLMSMPPPDILPVQTTVYISVPETTSTIMTIDNTEDQA